MTSLIPKDQNISIFNGCDVRIENSVTRVTVRHHEAVRVMRNSYPEWRNFQFESNNHYEFSFLLTFPSTIAFKRYFVMSIMGLSFLPGGGGAGEWCRGRAAPHLWRGGLDFHSSSKVGSSKFCPAVREILLLFNKILPRVASENHKYALYLFFFVFGQLQPKVYRDILFSNNIIVDDNALHGYILLR